MEYHVSKVMVEKELLCPNGHTTKQAVPENIYFIICQTCGHAARTEKIPKPKTTKVPKHIKLVKDIK